MRGLTDQTKRRYVNLVQALRLARELKRWSRRRLAAEVHASYGTIGLWETCSLKRAPSVLSLIRWASALEVEI